MAIIDTHRASYNKVDGNIRCGKRDTVNTNQPSVTEHTVTFYSVRLPNGKTKQCDTIRQVNEVLLSFPTASVVKTTRTVTTTVTHKKIR